MRDPAAAPPPLPPLGSWARLYAVVCVAAVAVMAVLWWFTAVFNIPLAKP